MTYEQLLKDATEQAEFWAKARDRADLLARSEHAAKLAESKANEILALNDKIKALDVKHGERVQALEVAANKEQVRLEASLAPLKAKLAQTESASVARVSDLEQKVVGLQAQVQMLIAQRAELQGQVSAAERKLTDLHTAWDKVRQKVGAA